MEEDITAQPGTNPPPAPEVAAATEAPAAPARAPRLEQFALVLLLLILLVGAYFRFTGLNWDSGTHLHPDERFLTGVAAALRPVSDPLTYLNSAESPLNPYNLGFHFYVYGNLPMTITRYVGEWITQVCAGFPGSCAAVYNSYDGIHLVGRFLSGLVDLVSVAFIYFTGRRLYDWRAGLIAAALMATAVLPIQQSHFFTMDNWSAAFTVVAFYAAVRAAQQAEQKRWWALFGLFLGFAVASRINVALLAGIAGASALVWLVRGAAAERALAGGGFFDYLASARGQRDLRAVVIGLLLAALFAVVSFRLAQPYAFGDNAASAAATESAPADEAAGLLASLRAVTGLNPQFLRNMAEIQGQQSPEAAHPPALQWTDRAPIVFPWTNMVLYGMGLAAGLTAWFGFFWALWRIIRARPDWTVHLLPVSWVAVYFLFTATRWVKSIRYFLPIYPILFLLAGWALVELWKRAGDRRPQRIAAGALTALVLLSTLLWANAFVELYRQPLTRVAASRWMYENVPTAATLFYEVDGERRQTQLPLKIMALAPTVNPAVSVPFTMPADGRIVGVQFNHVTDPDGSNDGEALQLALRDAAGAVLATGAVETAVGRAEQRVFVPLEPAQVSAEAPLVLDIHLGPGGGLTLDTSRIMNEVWDDLLPVNIDGKNSYGNYYTEVTGGQRPIIWPDTNEDKRREMIAWIDEADVIALSSQRALWSTPRLPLTYPLNIRYYEALFNGELGFDLVAQFHGDLHIGPLYISDTGGEIGWGQLPQIGWPPPGDLAAEEAFSVYDHPPVWIFQKRDDYDPARVREILNAVDLSETIVMNPGQATRAPNGLLLTGEQRAIQQENGSFSELFATDGLLARYPALAAAAWWLATVLFGWITFPLAFVVFRGFAGRGYAPARILGILLVSYFGWLTASLGWLPNSRGTLLLGCGLLAALSAVIYWRHRRQMNDWLRERAAYVGFVELFGLAFFALALLIRLGNPDVWDVIWGGEKPMDLSYFTAVLKSASFPPYDPWFAGGTINYYYYGFVYAGVLTHLLAVPPTLAYNLIVPMLFSFTALAAFSIAFNVAAMRRLRRGERGPAAAAGGWPRRKLPRGPLAAGIAAALFCVLLGNLAEVGVLLDSWQRASDIAVTDSGVLNAAVRTADGAFRVLVGGESPPIGTGDWFWTASRAINAEPGEAAPITEFPFFTFLYGDLHAHMISLPLTLLALAWAVSLVLATARFRALPPLSRWGAFGALLTGALAIGVLRPTNTWDWPTYLLLGCLSVAYVAYAGTRRWELQTLGAAAVNVVLLIALSTLAFRPYISSYGAGYESARLWEGSYTRLANYLVIYGLFLFLVVTHLAREFRAWTASWTLEGMARRRKVAWWLVGVLALYVLLLAGFLIRGYWVLPVAVTLTVVAGLLGVRPGRLPIERRVVLVLISSALGLTALVEVVVLEGDVGRMNTVFKFYMQVWSMLSVVSGVALAWAWPRVRREWPRPRRRIWQVALALLLAAAALYPLLATRAKWQTRMAQDAPRTLDGMAFMPYVEYGDTAADGSPRIVPLEHEYEALRWMQEHIPGTPVIVEAHSGDPYRSIAGRVAMYTGLPTVIGWDWHQRQQRATVPDAVVWSRVDDVRTIFQGGDANLTRQLLEKYGVEYVYVGELERTYYGADGPVKFARMAAQGLLEEVFRNEGVTIYRVVARPAEAQSGAPVGLLPEGE